MKPLKTLAELVLGAAISMAAIGCLQPKDVSSKEDAKQASVQIKGIEENLEEPDPVAQAVADFYVPVHLGAIGHEVLLMEKAGKPAKAAFDSLITKASHMVVKREPKDTRAEMKQAYEFFSRIHYFLNREGFNYKEDSLFGEAVQSKTADCSDYSLIYLSIAESCGLPVSAVSAPNHMFVRWTFSDNSHMNWETTAKDPVKAMKDDDFYIEKFKIHQDALENKVFLKPMSNDQIISKFCIRSAEKIGASEEELLEECERAVKLDPDNYAAYSIRAGRLLKKGKTEQAIDDYDTALLLNPGEASIYLLRASAKWRAKRLQEAMQDVEESIKINKEDVFAYELKAQILLELGKHKESEKEYSKAIAMSPFDSGLYNGRYLARNLLGDSKGASEDVKMYDHLEKMKKKAGIEEFTEADKFLMGFPEKIPGARSVKKYHVPGAKHTLVHINQCHFVQDQEFPQKESDMINRTHDNIYQIIRFLAENNKVDKVYYEGMISESAPSLDKHQTNQDMIDLMPSAGRLMLENIVSILPFENSFLVSEYLNDGHSDKELRRYQEFHDKREDHLLGNVSERNQPYAVVVLGGAHEFGSKKSVNPILGIPFLRRSCGKNNIEEWNKQHEDKFSFIEVTPYYK